LFVVLLVMAPSSQELEPPAIPGQFTPPKTSTSQCYNYFNHRTLAE
jgi:hypothetical protein